MKESLSYITIDMMLRFSAKDRGYMLTHSHKSLKNEMSALEGEVKIEWDYGYNEKIQKTYCSHCDTNCINGTFIYQVLRNSIGVKLESEEI